MPGCGWSRPREWCLPMASGCSESALPSGCEATMRAHPAGAPHGDVTPLTHQLPPPPADLGELDVAIWPLGAHRKGGALQLGGIDVRDLADSFGTPVYVLVEDDVRARCRA